MPFKSWFWALEHAGGSWLGFGILILIWCGNWSLMHPWSDFWISISISKVQKTSRSFKFSFGALEDAGDSWLVFIILILICIWSFFYTHDPNFGSLSWFWRCKEHPCPLSPHLGLWRMLEVPDWGLASWSWFGYGHWSLIYPWSKFWLSILILKVQRTSISFKSSFGALEDTGGSWLEFCVLIMIWIWSVALDTPIFPILYLFLDFGGAENISAM